MVEPLFGALQDRLHSVFELRERDTHTLFSDDLSFHVLQLSALPPSSATGYDGGVERWARFLIARDHADLEPLAAESPIMQLAKQTLEELSQDPETRRLARERTDAIRLYEMGLAASRAEGEAQGRAEGEAQGRAEGEAQGRAALLLKLLTLRFGSLSPEIRARVAAATIEQLDAWAERILTQGSLDEVLA